MAFVAVPKDLSRVKPKFLFNLTRRQLICFGSGALVGVPLFFLLKTVLPASAASMLMVVSMLPFFLFGLYERNGQPLEKTLCQIIQTRYMRPRVRPYQTNNFYAALSRQIQLNKEVKRIVQKYNQAPANSRGEKADRRSHRPGKA